MAFKPTHVRRKSCPPLYILCIEVSRFLVKLETKINFQNAVTFVLVKLDPKFQVQNSFFLLIYYLILFLRIYKLGLTSLSIAISIILLLHYYVSLDNGTFVESWIFLSGYHRECIQSL